jgi:hypothetical protein
MRGRWHKPSGVSVVLASGARAVRVRNTYSGQTLWATVTLHAGQSQEVTLNFPADGDKD